MRYLRALLAGLCALGVARLASAHPAQAGHAADGGELAEQRARALFERGLTDVAAQRWAQAEEAFRQSSELVPRSSALYNLARVRFELGRELPCLEALDQFELASDREPDSPYDGYAAELKQRVLRQRGYVRIDVAPSDARLMIDDTTANTESAAQRRLLLAAGTHDVGVSADGYANEHWTFELQPGASLQHDFRLLRLPPAVNALPIARVTAPAPLTPTAADASPKSPPAARADTPLLPWIAIGSGAALAVASIVTGVVAKHADSEFVRRCGGTSSCDPALRPLQTRATRFALATDILLASGLISAAVGGIGLWLGASASHEQLSASLTLRCVF